VWEKHGLMPSEKYLSDKMDNLINACLIDLINSDNKNLSHSDFETILDKGIDRFNDLHYDTEEKEIIAEKFNDIATIINIDISKRLNIWMYGRVLSTINDLFSQEETNFVGSQIIKCSDCNNTLTQGFLEVEGNIPSYWTIVNCEHCGETNLFPAIGNIKETVFLNCTYVNLFVKAEFDSSLIEQQLKKLKINKKGS
jgi:hypothetical protein